MAIRQHASTAERCAAAASFAADFGVIWPLLVDPVERDWPASPLTPAAAASAAAGVAAAPAAGAAAAPAEASVAAVPEPQLRQQAADSGAAPSDRKWSGPFDAAFAPWPLRFYVIDRQGVLRFRADPQDCSYHLHELSAWLEKHAGRPAPAC